MYSHPLLYQVRDLCFDSSGTYLAVAGSDVRVYLCKQWNELKVSDGRENGSIYKK